MQEKKVEAYLAEVKERKQTIADLIHYLDALRKKTKYLPEPQPKRKSWLGRLASLLFAPFAEGL